MKTLLSLIILSAISVLAQAEEVSVESGDFTLKGTLLKSEKKTGTAVLLIAGSGPTDRNGNSVGAPMKCDNLKLLAQALHQADITSLRYDKRGVAASSKEGFKEGELRFGQLVDDAVSWCQFLNQQGYQKVILIGHSEGALVATLAAQQSKAAGLVLVAGAGRKASQLLRAQLKAQLPPAYFRRANLTLNALEAGNQVENNVPALNQLFRASVQPYLISWFKHDPAKDLAQVKSPVLIVQGSTDLQTSKADAQRLHSMAKGSQLEIIDGMNHVLKQQSGDIVEQTKSYTDPSLPLHPKLAPLLIRFVKEASKG